MKPLLYLKLPSCFCASHEKEAALPTKLTKLHFSMALSYVIDIIYQIRHGIYPNKQMKKRKEKKRGEERRGKGVWEFGLFHTFAGEELIHSSIHAWGILSGSFSLSLYKCNV